MRTPKQRDSSLTKYTSRKSQRSNRRRQHRSIRNMYLLRSLQHTHVNINRNTNIIRRSIRTTGTINNSLRRTHSNLRVYKIHYRHSQSKSNHNSLNNDQARTKFITTDSRRLNTNNNRLANDHRTSSTNPTNRRGPLANRIRIIIPVIRPQSGNMTSTTRPTSSNHLRYNVGGSFEPRIALHGYATSYDPRLTLSPVALGTEHEGKSGNHQGPHETESTS